MAKQNGRRLTSSTIINRLNDTGQGQETCVFRGIIAPGEDEDHIRFSIGGAAAGRWQAIPTRLVQSIQPLAKVQAGEDVHHWVNLELRKPQSVADGQAFASIAQDFAAAAHASPAASTVGLTCPPDQHVTFDPNTGTYVCAPGAP
jgi:hypothetical protein